MNFHLLVRCSVKDILPESLKPFVGLSCLNAGEHVLDPGRGVFPNWNRRIRVPASTPARPARAECNAPPIWVIPHSSGSCNAHPVGAIPRPSDNPPIKDWLGLDDWQAV
jgi:hypothetical protein